MEMARRDKLTLRELYYRVAAARGHLLLVGTPVQIADVLERWFRAGAADGFNVMPPFFPGQFDAFADQRRADPPGARPVSQRLRGQDPARSSGPAAPLTGPRRAAQSRPLNKRSLMGGNIMLPGCWDDAISPSGRRPGWRRSAMPALAQGEPIKVGVIVPLSGPAGPNGQGVAHAVADRGRDDQCQGRRDGPQDRGHRQGRREHAGGRRHPRQRDGRRRRSRW